MRQSHARWPALVTALGVSLGLALFSATPVSAQEETEKTAPVMVTMDASGSMADELDGTTKMDAAKDALNTLVDGLDSDAEMGLQVYGSKGAGSGSGNPTCEDISTEVPVGPVDAAQIKSKVAALEPAGETPIGDSLKQAAQELPDEGPRAIVLISDGIDTCAPPDPCEVAKDLAEDGVDLAVHTVGFQIDEKAKEQLSCIAESTGGSYTDAPDAKTLDEQLPKVVERAQRQYEAEGIPITGTEDYPDAPEIEAGQYVDEIDSGQRKHYKIEIPDGYSVHFAATAIMPKDETGGWAKLNTSVMDPQGQACAGNDESFAVRSGNSWQAHGTSAFGWDSSTEGDCNADGEYYLTVERDGPSESKYWTWETELIVVLEPPLAGSAGPAENTSEVPFDNPGGSDKPVTGGGSFNDATELPDSGTYTDTVRGQEMATYKIKLDWGESLAVQVNGKNPTKEWARLTSTVYDPTRKSGSDWDDFSSVKDDTETLDDIATPRVLYNNRGERDELRPGIAGWYYITVQVGESPNSKVEMPIRMFVSKGGEKVAPPEYAQVDGNPAGPITEPQAPESEEQGQQAQSVDQTAGEQDGGIPVWVWFTIGGAVVLGIGIASGLTAAAKKKRKAAAAQQYYGGGYWQ
ncbi:Ca-activated chloride channel family protein [Tamaricihabitans halophyticus]|uniref:Ca-activated chloride channel family protein n=1 Tax=Tamaricihabitans halophyticus TaxID=1262583 RepID=A0A4R2R695_9PSEU|nr:VWA domain-containing protein [Tamaricihabitans halophyticus]TCP57348.1 Ca-activated chloride channel family protein [Tamaricihabitans halophyticus]